MKVFVVGLGLIGGSFALALKDRGLCDVVWGLERDEERAREALERGLCDRIVGFDEGVSEADLVVLATPVDTLPLMAIKALNRMMSYEKKHGLSGGKESGAKRIKAQD